MLCNKMKYSNIIGTEPVFFFLLPENGDEEGWLKLLYIIIFINLHFLKNNHHSIAFFNQVSFSISEYLLSEIVRQGTNDDHQYGAS